MMDRHIISRMSKRLASKALPIISFYFCVFSGGLAALWFIGLTLSILSGTCSTTCLVTYGPGPLVITVSLLLVYGVWHFPWFRLSRGQILLVLLATAVGLTIGLFFIPESCSIDNHPNIESTEVGGCFRGYPAPISIDSIRRDPSTWSISSPSELYAYVQQNPEDVNPFFRMPAWLICLIFIIDLLFYIHAGIIVVFLLSGILSIFVRPKTLHQG